MKSKMFIALLLLSSMAMGQVTKATLQASGLTCSMCSNAINKSLKSIDFVEKVDANIKNSTFDIAFKPGSEVDFDRVKKAVEDAGFFVAGLTAVVHFDKTKVENDSHVNLGTQVYHFLNIKDQELNGDKTIRLLDKGYVSSKEYRKNALFTKMGCYKTGVAAKCCATGGVAEGTRVYHITI